jgi:mono/diheme cytochrome c family protein
MRHFLVNLAVYTIATLLVLGSALWAWMRSAQLTIANEETLVARFAAQPGHVFEWRELGARSYLRNCVNCHRADGSGWDQYPGVTHSGRLFASPGGRDYLVDLHLYGLTSNRWRAPMPPMGHIPDVEMAAMLNHLLTHFGNDRDLPPDARLYLPDEISARRGQRLRPHDINTNRPVIRIPARN